MKLRIVRLCGNAFIILGILSLAVSIMSSGFIQVLLSVIGILLTVLGFFLFLLFWKCPYCHMHLPFSGLLGIKFCPYCGNDLEL